RPRSAHVVTSGMPLPTSAEDELLAKRIESAGRLRKRAVDVVQSGRSAEGIQLLHEALRSLPISSGSPSATAVRIRVLATLAFAEAETGSVNDGLVHIGTASDLVRSLPDSQLRKALRGLVDHQHGAILLRSRRTAEALVLFDKAIPMLE